MVKIAWGWIIKIIVSIGLLVAFWFLIDLKLLGEYFANILVLPLLVLVLLIPFSIALRSIRFQYIINYKKKLMSFVDSFNLALVGETLNMIIPASGGDVAKAYYGFKKHNLKEEMISVVVLDKVVGLVSLLLLGSVASILMHYYVLSLFFIGLLLISSAIVFFPRFIPWYWLTWLQKKFNKKIVNVKKLRQSFSQPLLVKLNATLFAVAGWIASYVMLFVIAAMFSIDINIFFLFTVAPLITLSRLLPISWAGLGVQEGVTIYLFNLAGIGAAASVAVSLVFTLSSTILPGLFGWYHIVKLKTK